MNRQPEMKNEERYMEACGRLLNIIGAPFEKLRMYSNEQERAASD
jgi:hypothetical protein